MFLHYLVGLTNSSTTATVHMNHYYDMLLFSKSLCYS